MQMTEALTTSASRVPRLHALRRSAEAARALLVDAHRRIVGDRKAGETARANARVCFAFRAVNLRAHHALAERP